MSTGTSGATAKGKVAAPSASKNTAKRKKGIFQKELQPMMYGFGDDRSPLPETVALVEDMVLKYVTDVAHKAQEIGTTRGELAVEDFLHVIRKDKPKVNRCKELLSMQAELEQARKIFNDDEGRVAANID